MRTFATTPRTLQAATLAAAMTLATSCALEKQPAPGLMGPSELGLSVTLSASPDMIARDGMSQSVITARVRDAQSRVVPGKRLVLGTSAGSLSAYEVTTDSGGTASVTFVAPGVNTSATEAVVTAVPVGDNADNSVPRIVTIGLAGPSVPAATFTMTPASPKQFELVTFDASTTTVGGIACGSSCSYSWTFGTSGTGTGRLTTYRFTEEGAHMVTLTVTAPGGTSASRTQLVTVAVATAPTAVIAYSPRTPQIGDLVYFSGTGSRGANGEPIKSYEWDFGNGQRLTSTDPTASTTFVLDRTYEVRLTVRDSNGVVGTKTELVNVTKPTTTTAVP